MCSEGRNRSFGVDRAMEIRSPNYPGRYPPNQDCTYTFTPVHPHRMGIRIDFREYRTEYDYDFLEISCNGSLIARFAQVFSKSTFPLQNPEFPFALHSVAQEIFVGRCGAGEESCGCASGRMDWIITKDFWPTSRLTRLSLKKVSSLISFRRRRLTEGESEGKFKF